MTDRILSNEGDDVDFRFQRGITFDALCQVTDDDDVPTDITGRTYTGVCKINGEVVANISCVVTDAANGFFSMRVEDSQTATMQLGNAMKVFVKESYSGVTNAMFQDRKTLVFD